MIETIVLALIVSVAAVASGRHLFREVVGGKQKCSGCGDDCPLAKACSCRNAIERADGDAPPGCPIRSGHIE